MSLSLSPTQQPLGPELIARLVGEGFGGAVDVVDSAVLTGGGFASVVRVTLSDGRDVVLKVGPAPGTALLEYEAGMIAAEVRYLRLAGPDVLPGSPMAHLYAAGGGGPESEWMITGLIPGVSLASLVELGDVSGPAASVREQLGAAMARVHGVYSPTGRFGYEGHCGYEGRVGYEGRPGCEGDRPHGATWGEAFTAIIMSLLRDARVWDVKLPAPDEKILALVDAHRGELDGVTRASLLHFDLWDGNLLCSPADGDAGGDTDGDADRDTRGDADGGADASGLVLTGLVDGERYLFGDPLVDFVSPALFRRIEDEATYPGGHPFVRGYGRSTAFTDGEVRRLTLYRMHLYLLMVIEMPSRGMVGAEFSERDGYLRRLLDAELARLRA